MKAREKTTIRKMARGNKLGLPGVSYSQLGKKWFSRIRMNGRSVYLGMFETPEAASKAYLAAAEKREAEFKKSISP